MEPIVNTKKTRTGLMLLALTVMAAVPATQVRAQSTARTESATAELSSGEQKLAANSKAGHTTFVLFYTSNDRATQAVYQTLTAETSKRTNASILPIRANDPAERGLIERFDVTRTPLPAVFSLASNGAVTGVFSQQIKPEEVEGAIVTVGYAECIKAMQANRIVLLCVQPATRGFVPKGVQQFQADRLYHDRTQVVNISATDPAEARFIQQLRLKSDATTPQVVFMAPPGVLLGTYDANVTHGSLIEKLVAAGKCCDDKNCKHHRTATGATSTQTR